MTRSCKEIKRTKQRKDSKELKEWEEKKSNRNWYICKDVRSGKQGIQAKLMKRDEDMNDHHYQ